MDEFSSAPLVSLDTRDRIIVRQLVLGGDVKSIAGAMEIAISTVNTRINSMCDRAKVKRLQLVMWVLQHPQCLIKGVSCDPGLHIPPCDCGSPGCLGMIAMQLAS